MLANRLNVLVTIMLAVVLLVMELSSAQMDDYRQVKSKPKREIPRRYCGKNLSNALQILCDGVYNTMFKKNGHEEMEMADYPATYELSPFLSRAKAHAIFYGLENRRYRRHTRGIYEECCLNSCTLSELRTYCGEST